MREARADATQQSLLTELRLCEVEAETERGDATVGQQQRGREADAAAEVMCESVRDAEQAWVELLHTSEEERARLEAELAEGDAGWAESAAAAAAREAAAVEAAHSEGAGVGG